jgi:hypothetical protein
VISENKKFQWQVRGYQGTAARAFDFLGPEAGMTRSACAVRTPSLPARDRQAA